MPGLTRPRLPNSSTPRVITHGFDFAAAMAHLVREQSGQDDSSATLGRFGEAMMEAMRQAMRIEVGQRVVNIESGEFGRVAIDPVPDGDVNDIEIIWDASPHDVQIVHRGTVAVGPPKNSALVAVGHRASRARPQTLRPGGGPG